MAGTLHDDAIVIDGLIIANFSRAVFLDMRRGGLKPACAPAGACRRPPGDPRTQPVLNRHHAP